MAKNKNVVKGNARVGIQQGGGVEIRKTGDRTIRTETYLDGVKKVTETFPLSPNHPDRPERKTGKWERYEHPKGKR
jgi:hypothetical protein